MYSSSPPFHHRGSLGLRCPSSLFPSWGSLKVFHPSTISAPLLAPSSLFWGVSHISGLGSLSPASSCHPLGVSRPSALDSFFLAPSQGCPGLSHASHLGTLPPAGSRSSLGMPHPPECPSLFPAWSRASLCVPYPSGLGSFSSAQSRGSLGVSQPSRLSSLAPSQELLSPPPEVPSSSLSGWHLLSLHLCHSPQVSMEKEELVPWAFLSPGLSLSHISHPSRCLLAFFL